jgi:UTP--glucose-1-phosphate uridylyltransferase
LIAIMREYAGDLMIKRAVIPAAGLGTRFLPATKAQPKEMLPIVDKPAIQFVVEEAVASGIRDILIVTGKGKRAIEDHFDRAAELEQHLRAHGKTEAADTIRKISELADIQYVRQKEQKGLGDAINCARSFANGEPFAVLSGDDIFVSETPCTRQLMDVFDKKKASVVAVERIPRERADKYGIVKPASQDSNIYLLEDLVEKPAPGEAPSDLAVGGRYILTPEIFGILDSTEPGHGGEIQLTDAMRTLLKSQKIYACEVDAKRYDVGDKLGYIIASIDFGLQRQDIAAQLREYITEVLK